jgi:prophage regulatory protein
MTAPDRFLRRRDMLATVGIPQSTVYLMMSRGEFPRSYQITRRLVGWKLSELQAWMESRPGYEHRPQKAA